MENKQTAADWLIFKCKDSLDREPIDATQQEIGYSKALNHIIILLEQAKQMEKEQIIQFADEYADAVMGGCINRAEEYYNETYGSQAPQRLEQANGTNLPKE